MAFPSQDEFQSMFYSVGTPQSSEPIMNIDRPSRPTEKYFADIEFEQKVAEIIRLQDEYQKKSDQLFNACMTQSPDEHSIGSRRLEINESDKYPPSKRTYNPRLSHKPAWVDSITTSLYSSMSSQPGLPSAESHLKGVSSI